MRRVDALAFPIRLVPRPPRPPFRCTPSPGPRPPPPRPPPSTRCRRSTAATPRRSTRCGRCCPSPASCAHRVRVEVAWLIALSDAGLRRAAAVLRRRRARGCARCVDALLRGRRRARSRRSRRVTNHDVKAVEYWLKERFADAPADVAAELGAASEFIHFACTSRGHQQHVARADAQGGARRRAAAGARRASARGSSSSRIATPTSPMLSRTHGQTASPTTRRQGIRERRCAARRARSSASPPSSCSAR